MRFARNSWYFSIQEVNTDNGGPGILLRGDARLRDTCTSTSTRHIAAKKRGLNRSILRTAYRRIDYENNQDAVFGRAKLLYEESTFHDTYLSRHVGGGKK